MLRYLSFFLSNNMFLLEKDHGRIFIFTTQEGIDKKRIELI